MPLGGERVGQGCLKPGERMNMDAILIPLANAVPVVFVFCGVILTLCALAGGGWQVGRGGRENAHRLLVLHEYYGCGV